MRTALLVLAASLCAAPSAAQQTAVALNIESARAQLELLETQGYDSARVLLEGALRATTVRGERIRSYTLLAFAHLGLRNRLAARGAFEQALRLDPVLSIDSLILDASAPEVFAQARNIVGTVQAADVRLERVALLLTVILPTDTTIAAADSRLPIILHPNTQSRVITTIASPSARAITLWSDTQTFAGRKRIDWPLRKADGAAWSEGTYLLRAHAVDTIGQMTTEERIVKISRAAVDTQAHPAPLPATAFAPEMLPAATKTKPRLLIGSGVALMAALAPSVLGSSELNSGGDPTSFAVGGGVALFSVVGFLKSRKPQPIRDNIAKNKTLRDNFQRQRDAVAFENADARSKAPFRIVVERAP